MPIDFAELMGSIHQTDPYDGFDASGYADDIQSNGDNDLVSEVVADLAPQSIVEIGSWKGASAVAMATQLLERGIKPTILCIDTWLGSIEHIDGTFEGWDIRAHHKHGYPTLFYQFLANIVRRDLQGCIVPFPQTSATALRWLARRGTVFDMAYIDGSHEYADVYSDIKLAWRIVRHGGVLVGDDIRWAGVHQAISQFSEENGLEQNLVIRAGKWALAKQFHPDLEMVIADFYKRITS